MARAIRDSSPPEATFEIACKGWPGVGGDAEFYAVCAFRRQVILFKANIYGEHPMRHRQRMHAVGNVLAQLLGA